MPYYLRIYKVKIDNIGIFHSKKFDKNFHRFHTKSFENLNLSPMKSWTERNPIFLCHYYSSPQPLNHFENDQIPVFLSAKTQQALRTQSIKTAFAFLFET